MGFHAVYVSHLLPRNSNKLQYIQHQRRQEYRLNHLHFDLCHWLSSVLLRRFPRINRLGSIYQRTVSYFTKESDECFPFAGNREGRGYINYIGEKDGHDISRLSLWNVKNSRWHLLDKVGHSIFRLRNIIMVIFVTKDAILYVFVQYDYNNS